MSKGNANKLTTKNVVTNMLSVENVANLLGKQVRTVQRYFEDGLLKGEKFGRDWFTTPYDLERFEPPAYRGGRPAKKAKKSK